MSRDYLAEEAEIGGRRLLLGAAFTVEPLLH